MAFDDSLISVILPVHNARMFLQTCLESLVKQTYENIEIIAIDDFSKDDSLTILNDFKKQDKRIRVFKNKKQYGLAVCFNRALKKARGQYIAFMDPADKSSVHRMKSQLDYLLENPKIAVVGAQCTYLDETNKTVSKTSLPENHEAIMEHLLQGDSLQFESVMINKILLPKDVLKFKTHTYPFMYIDVFMNVFKYGKAANLSKYLHYRRANVSPLHAMSTKHLSSYAKIITSSITNSHVPVSFRSLFTPLLRQI